MTARHAGTAAILLLILAGAIGWWWTRPERQIRAILDDVATALTHQDGESGLETLAAAAALERHLAENVSVDLGGRYRIDGKDAVVTAAARLRAQTAPRRVRFIDPRITFAGDGEAQVTVTAEVTGSDGDVANVHEVVATLRRDAQRWVVVRAQSPSLPEPPS